MLANLKECGTSALIFDFHRWPKARSVSSETEVVPMLMREQAAGSLV